jgi:hypothetical protein
MEKCFLLCTLWASYRGDNGESSLACVENLLFLHGVDKRLPQPGEGKSSHPVHGVRAGLSPLLFLAVLYPTHSTRQHTILSAGLYMRNCTVSLPKISQSELSQLKLHNLYIFSVCDFLSSFAFVHDLLFPHPLFRMLSAKFQGEQYKKKLYELKTLNI